MYVPETIQQQTSSEFLPPQGPAPGLRASSNTQGFLGMRAPHCIDDMPLPCPKLFTSTHSTFCLATALWAACDFLIHGHLLGGPL